MGEVAGIAGRAGRRARQLRRHGLAHDDGAGRAQGGDAARVLARAIVLEQRRARFGRHVGGVDHVLDADGNAMQDAEALALAAHCIGGARLCQAHGRDRGTPTP